MHLHISFTFIYVSVFIICFHVMLTGLRDKAGPFVLAVIWGLGDGGFGLMVKVI
jgi:hypothetical protein